MQRTWKDSAVSLIVAGAAVLLGIGATSGTVSVFDAILLTMVVGLTALLALPMNEDSTPEEYSAAEVPATSDFHIAA